MAAPRTLQVLLQRLLTIDDVKAESIVLPHGYRINAGQTVNLSVSRILLRSPPPPEASGTYVLLCVNGMDQSVLLSDRFATADHAPVLTGFTLPQGESGTGLIDLTPTQPARGVFRPTLPINQLDVSLRSYPPLGPDTIDTVLDIIIHLRISL